MTEARKVLLVEDDEATRVLFAHYLEGENCEVLTASDGKEGVETAVLHRPSLVILDLMLPELHGIGVCQTLKAHPATIGTKVLIASVKGFPADRKQAFQAGADGFLTKPVSRQDFLAEVRKLLR